MHAKTNPPRLSVNWRIGAGRFVLEKRLLFTAIALAAHELGQACKHDQHRPCEIHCIPRDGSVLAEQKEDTKSGNKQRNDRVMRTLAHLFVHHINSLLRCV